MLLAIFEIPPEPVSSEPSPSLTSHPYSASPTLLFRIWLFLFGVIAPVFCLVAASFQMAAIGGKLWQSGRWDTHVQILLQSPPILYPMPLLLFHLVCMAIWCIAPSRAKWSWIRFGLYSGLFCSSYYTLLAIIAFQAVTLLTAVFIFPFVLTLHILIRVASSQKHRLTIRRLMILTAGFAGIASLLRWAIDDVTKFFSVQPSELLFALAIFLILAAPVNSVIAFSLAVVCIRRESTIHVSPRRLGWMAWLTYFLSFFVLWRLSIRSMFDEYAKLPPTEPGCYVCSAAAHGHPWLTKSTRPFGENGPAINLQMQRLKLLEFGMATACPCLHRWIRTIYDRVGPRLAHYCRRSPIVSDVTYIALMPVELFAELIRRSSGISLSELKKLYWSFGIVVSSDD